MQASQNIDLRPLDYVPPVPEVSFPRGATPTSVDIPPAAFAIEGNVLESLPSETNRGRGHAVLVIERGNKPGTEFLLVNDDSILGRWDADNGIFPDVDLDAFDPDAKVSRRHARIRRTGGTYTIEDLGSTNGTYVNRGRRLLPGSPQLLNDGDEVIIGKTFLRFQITH
jgi:FHA domain